LQRGFRAGRPSARHWNDGNTRYGSTK
jgi:hypothetical protein